MTNDVFISYESTDKHTADAICSTLENSNIRCWFAPRDILPGSNWPQSITNAIKASKIMVLIFSRNSNKSNQVSKELNLAVSNNLMIIPFKIDDSVPNGSLEYFLADRHWLDAIDGDKQAQINNLRDVIASVLSKQNPVPESPAQPVPPVPPVPPAERKIGFLEAYKLFWVNCFNYKGCASLAEYWKAYAVNVGISLLIFSLLSMLAGPDVASAIFALYAFAVILPNLSIAVRRLHDSNHSAHWLWLFFTLYGGVVPFVFLFFQSVIENNRFRNN